jgi:hypothetical protein
MKITFAVVANSISCYFLLHSLIILIRVILPSFKLMANIRAVWRQFWATHKYPRVSPTNWELVEHIIALHNLQRSYGASLTPWYRIFYAGFLPKKRLLRDVPYQADEFDLPKELKELGQARDLYYRNHMENQ